MSSSAARPVRSQTERSQYFPVLLSLLAAVLAFCILIIAKDFVIHPGYREAIVLAAITLLAPLLIMALRWLADTLLEVLVAAGISWLGKNAHPWVYRGTICLLLCAGLYNWLEPFLDYFFAH